MVGLGGKGGWLLQLCWGEAGWLLRLGRDGGWLLRLEHSLCGLGRMGCLHKACMIRMLLESWSGGHLRQLM